MYRFIYHKHFPTLTDDPQYRHSYNYKIKVSLQHFHNFNDGAEKLGTVACHTFQDSLCRLGSRFSLTDISYHHGRPKIIRSVMLSSPLHFPIRGDLHWLYPSKLVYLSSPLGRDDFGECHGPGWVSGVGTYTRSTTTESSRSGTARHVRLSEFKDCCLLGLL